MADLTLVQHLQRGAAEPFVWGVNDCCLWIADWILAQRGVDPAAELRGRYHTARGSRRQIARRGGFDIMMADLMRAAGINPTDDPHPGDIGIIETGRDRRPNSSAAAVMALALCTGPSWAVRSERGIMVSPMTIRSAWRVVA